MILTFTLSPDLKWLTILGMSAMSFTGTPAIDVIMSPLCIPAKLAGDSGTTLLTNTPAEPLTPN
jgi:hypothetical protein